MTDQEIWVVNWVSADRTNIGTTVELFSTKHEAIEAVRGDVKDRLDGGWDDGEYSTQEEADKAYDAHLARLAAMRLDELQTAYREDASDSYIQEVYVYKVKAPVAPPDVSSPDKIEAFLETK